MIPDIDPIVKKNATRLLIHTSPSVFKFAAINTPTIVIIEPRARIIIFECFNVFFFLLIDCIFVVFIFYYQLIKKVLSIQKVLRVLIDICNTDLPLPPCFAGWLTSSSVALHHSE